MAAAARNRIADLFDADEIETLVRTVADLIDGSDPDEVLSGRQILLANRAKQALISERNPSAYANGLELLARMAVSDTL